MVVGYQAVKEIRERCERDLGRFGAVEVAVVDGLAVGRVAE